MLDIKFIRENPKVIKKDLEKRHEKEKLKWVDDLLKKDVEYRKLLQDNQKLRQRRNEITDEINKLKKQGEDIKEKIKEAKELPDTIKQSTEKVEELRNKIQYYLMRLPNILHESVPIGKDENDNVVVKKWGTKPKFDFELKPHGELLEKLGLANFDKAAEVSGHGFYYLLGDIAKLELALIHFAVDFLTKENYVLVEPPLMLRRKPYEGVTDLKDFETMMYKVQDEDLLLIATSEHPIAAMLMNGIYDEKQLPLKFVGYSPCFRKELGSHSIDTRGIFRVHHFNKIEQFVFCKPEDSWKFHEELLKNAETLFQKLKIHYRVVNVCTGDIGTVAAKKYDIEAWSPRENLYREVVSCSNCTSYQATRLNIKYRKGKEKEFAHTLNSTAIATSRALRAIIENYQQKDGSIKVPTVLQKYMGKKVIAKR
ncbi:serine--tRNA ligase [Candidatus Woesearchaeota archaeon]|jgi:seryl-tRNA synthetase|nr:serine--tRNA ligase [Candidatus Woesearchaeota archaeon]MDP6647981.1 serine--tRNA ligase [Candidatus Woesearchaeota archaeon]|tara:strand:+ start:21163 stop:22437 length:1275 start_codon:yes stop_codon:yes gene_type:complete